MPEQVKGRDRIQICERDNIASNMLLGHRLPGRALPAAERSTHRRCPLAAASAVEAPSAEPQPARKKVSLVSLGCPKNVVDGELVHGPPHGTGWRMHGPCLCFLLRRVLVAHACASLCMCPVPCTQPKSSGGQRVALRLRLEHCQVPRHASFPCPLLGPHVHAWHQEQGFITSCAGGSCLPSDGHTHWSHLLVLPGEVLLGDLYRSGFDVVSEHEDADAVIVNTCGFVEDAKTESLEVGLAGGQDVGAGAVDGA